MRRTANASAQEAKAKLIELVTEHSLEELLKWEPDELRSFAVALVERIDQAHQASLALVAQSHSMRVLAPERMLGSPRLIQRSLLYADLVLVPLYRPLAAVELSPEQSRQWGFLRQLILGCARGLLEVVPLLQTDLCWPIIDYSDVPAPTELHDRAVELAELACDDPWVGQLLLEHAALHVNTTFKAGKDGAILQRSYRGSFDGMPLVQDEATGLPVGATLPPEERLGARRLHQLDLEERAAPAVRKRLRNMAVDRLYNLAKDWLVVEQRFGAHVVAGSHAGASLLQVVGAAGSGRKMATIPHALVELQLPCFDQVAPAELEALRHRRSDEFDAFRAALTALGRDVSAALKDGARPEDILIIRDNLVDGPMRDLRRGVSADDLSRSVQVAGAASVGAAALGLAIVGADLALPVGVSVAYLMGKLTDTVREGLAARAKAQGSAMQFAWRLERSVEGGGRRR